MRYSKTFCLLYHDMDAGGTLYPSRLLTYLQETAHAHILTLTGGQGRLRREGLAFWLTRLCITTLAPLRAGETVTVETWGTDDSRGLRFGRSFRVVRGEETVCEGYSVWALMQIATGRPVAVRDWPVEVGTEAPLLPQAPLHIRLPDTPFATVDTYRVSYRDLDENGHMNNTRYPNLLCSCLPSLAGKRVQDLSISFLHEAPAGDTLTFTCCPARDAEDTYYLRSYRASDGAVNVEARITLVSL